MTSGDTEKTSGINPSVPITSGLQEILAFYSGEISKAPGRKIEFTKLLQTRSETSGSIDWDEATTGFGGQRVPNPEAKRISDKQAHIIGAQLKGTGGNTPDGKINAIFIADTDLVHDVMFNIFDSQVEDLVIDNTLFVMNCVDTLAGSDGYVQLRNRRPAQRTLKTIEDEKAKFDAARQKREQEATKEAEKSMTDAKDRIEKVLDVIRNDKTMDEGEMKLILENAAAAENRKLELEQKKIDQKKANAVRQARIESQTLVKAKENSTWFWAFFWSLVPAITLGVVVLVIRGLNEDSGAASDRLVSR